MKPLNKVFRGGLFQLNVQDNSKVSFIFGADFGLRSFVITVNNRSCFLARRKYFCVGVMSFLGWETFRFLYFN